MIAGFTGTLTGMTQKQREAMRYLFKELQVTELHHGDCVGADAEAHRDAARMGIEIVVHPPSDEKLRAFCDYSMPNRIVPAKPYLKRNRDIVAAAEVMIAAPKDMRAPHSLRGQGTWTTIGYARQAKKRLFIVYPDGTFWHEEQIVDVTRHQL